MEPGVYCDHHRHCVVAWGDDRHTSFVENNGTEVDLVTWDTPRFQKLYQYSLAGYDVKTVAQKFLGTQTMVVTHRAAKQLTKLISGATMAAKKPEPKKSSAPAKAAPKPAPKAAPAPAKGPVKVDAKATPKPTPVPAKATPKKDAGEDTPFKSRYKGKTIKPVKDCQITGREGSWTARMIEIATESATTDEATATLAKDKEFSDKRMDFGWLVAKGVITIQ